MGTPFLAELRIFSFAFPPKGWALCNGQLLPINQNQALFSLLGTTYGGNGQTTFALPDLRGRVPLHVGNGHTLGERGGEETHTLSQAEMPAHPHSLAARGGSGANKGTPFQNVWGSNSAVNQFSVTADTVMNPGAVTTVGGGQSHPNMPPVLTLSVCIALQGSYPTRN